MNWKIYLPEKLKKHDQKLKLYYDNKEKSIKLEIGNLQTQIEHLKKENPKPKAKITSFKWKHSRTQRSY